MISGVIGYFIYVNIPFLAPTRTIVHEIVSIVLPVLIFSMLFISFCKVDPHDLKVRPLHLWLLLIQVGFFFLFSIPLIMFPDTRFRIFYESAMICMITPTASAAAVVTNKLGGNTDSLVSYTIIINIFSAITIPLGFSLISSNSSFSFIHSFLIILGKVFSLLIFPFLLAWFVRVYLPKLHIRLIKYEDLAFYLWAMALFIAISVTVRSIVHSNISFLYEAGIALISLACCIFQFAIGRKIGGYYNELISGGQSLGQKNTGFSIWLGVTFLTPITSLAGGFYSVWHNLINSYQLYKKRKQDEDEDKKNHYN
jgi:bile acid:Na+ symporter, BASS family